MRKYSKPAGFLTTVKKLASIFLLSLLLIMPALGKQLSAVIISDEPAMRILIQYSTLTKDTAFFLHPRDTVAIVFTPDAYKPTTLTLSSVKYQGSLLALLPGDTISIRYNKNKDSYSFAGKRVNELNYYQELGKSKFSFMLPPEYGVVYSRKMNLTYFLAEWHKVVLESERYLRQLEQDPTIRPLIRAYLTREVKLYMLDVLLSPAVSQVAEGNLRELPEFYKDSVTARAQLVQNVELLPTDASQHIGAILRDYTIFKVVSAGKIPTFKEQYRIARKMYNGYCCELVCYSIIRDMQNHHKLALDLTSDYEKWVSPNSNLLKTIVKINKAATIDISKVPELNVTLVTTSGEQTKLFAILERNKGSVIYMDLWASWCGPCVAEMPASLEIRKRYANKGVVVVYLSDDTDHSKWLAACERFLSNGSESYRFADKTKYKLREAFEIRSIPRYILIDKAGIVRYSGASRPSNPTLRKELKSML